MLVTIILRDNKYVMLEKVNVGQVVDLEKELLCSDEFLKLDKKYNHKKISLIQKRNIISMMIEDEEE